MKLSASAHRPAFRIPSILGAFLLLISTGAWAQGTISGDVTLTSGTAPTAFPILVQAFDDPALTTPATPLSGEPVVEAGVSNPDSSPYGYTLSSDGSDFVDGTYHVVAFIDWNGDGTLNGTDLQSTAVEFVTIAGGNQTGVDFTIDVAAALFTDNDGDGLVLFEELLLGTNPGIDDTDDDGENDYNELFTDLTSPLYSMSPKVQRSLEVNGTPVALPNVGGRFDALSEWTVETWVRPSSGGLVPPVLETGSLIRHEVSATGRVTFDLRLDSNVPSINFDTPGTASYSAGGTAAIPYDEWTHLAASWNPVNRTLQLFVNGVPYRAKAALINFAATGAGTTEIGGITGHMDEVRIWSTPRTADEIAQNRNQLLNSPYDAGLNPAMVANYRFDDGGDFAEDFVEPTYPDAWSVNGFDVASNSGLTFDLSIFVSHIGIDDLDGNELPDWWELLWWGATGQVAGGDDDLDLLTNAFELLAGTNPLDDDTDNDGVLDSQEDFDSDGLNNLAEQDEGSDPLLVDTDDDGFGDGDEVNVSTSFDPTDSLSPLKDRVLNLVQDKAVPVPPATPIIDYVEMPIDSRFELADFTIQAWVKPYVDTTTPPPAVDNSFDGGTILQRQVASGKSNYNLTVNASGLVTIAFEDAAAGAETLSTVSGVGIDTTGSVWTHVAATFDSATGRLTILINGVQVATKVTSKRPMTNGVGPEYTRAGEGFEGQMDEVAIWGTALTAANVTSTLDGVDGAPVATPVSYYRFDDGTNAAGTSGEAAWTTGQVQEFSANISQTDWESDWSNAGTLVGDATMPENTDAPVLFSEKDSNGDGIPDWWWVQYGEDPATTTAATDDWDGDGLTNLQEFQVLADPNDSFSLDGTNVLTDAEYDSDGDGLSNIEEMTTHLTDPTLVDTDDDGVNDGSEVNLTNTHDPRSSLSPLKDRVLNLVQDKAVPVPPATPIIDYVEMPIDSRFELADFTIQAWVKPYVDTTTPPPAVDNSFDGGTILQREVEAGKSNYNLTVNASGLVTIAFEDAAAGAETLSTVSGVGIDTTGSVWTHVAATFDSATGRLTILINGVQVATKVTSKRPMTNGVGPEYTRAGEGFEGQMDEVAIWDAALTAANITSTLDGVAGAPVATPVSYYRFDDGTNAAGTSGDVTWTTGQVQDFSANVSQTDWESDWSNAGTLVGAATMPENTDAPVLFSEKDSNGDGIPDWWWVQYGEDPATTTAATNDWDNDGLTNLQEFQVLADPNDSFSLDVTDVLTDAEYDSDGDGLSNIEEMTTHLTDPTLVDTDDDGVNDGNEIYVSSFSYDPRSALSPLKDRVLNLVQDKAPVVLPATPIIDYVEMPIDPRFELADFTIQAWVKPYVDTTTPPPAVDNSFDGGTILQREVEAGKSNYNLSVDALGLVTISFEDAFAGAETLSTIVGIDTTGTGWTHVAATFDSATGRLTILINGAQVATKVTSKRPLTNGVGPEYIRAGEGFEGQMDEVAIWGTALTAANVTSTLGGVDGAPVATPVSYYRFDDGTNAAGTSGYATWTTGQVQEFSANISQTDWESDWSNAGTLVGAATMPENTGAPVLFTQRDSNGDGIPNWWWLLYGEDPITTTAALEDQDGDGLTNYQEYISGTDPTSWDGDLNGVSDAFELQAGTGLTHYETHNDGDFLPDSWERSFLPQLGPNAFNAFADDDFDGWNNLQEFLGGTSPLSAGDVPRPNVEIRVDWDGAISGTPIRWTVWDNAEMDGFPEAEGVVSPGVGNSQLVLDQDGNGNDIGALPSGAAYLLVYADLDASGTWNVDANGLPEPAGFPLEMPILLGAGNTTGLRVGLEVEPAGYRRIHWTAVAGQSSYNIRIVRRTTGSELIYNRDIVNRTYLHDWDFKLASMPYELEHAGSSKPAFEFYVDGVLTAVSATATDTLWGKDWTEPLATPTLVSPVGSFGTVGGDFTWTLSSGTPTRYILEIRQGSSTGAVVYEKTIPAPVPNPNGTLSYSPDLFTNGSFLPDGLYAWRVIAQQPVSGGVTSVSSAYTTFHLDTTEQPTGPFTVSGELIYMGRANVATADFIIQAFTSTNIFGPAFHQTTIDTAGQWSISGLPAGTYYLKAFLDVNGTGTHETWEPMGLLKSPLPTSETYTLKSITTGPGSTGNQIYVLDMDIDNDGFSDAWELQTYGFLTTVEAGNLSVTYPRHSTESGDAFGDALPFNTNLDSDADGVPDWIEMLYETDPSSLGDTPETSPGTDFLAITVNPVNSWLEIGLRQYDPPVSDQLTNLKYRIGLVTEYTPTLAPLDWQEIPGTRTDIQGTGPWYITPGGNMPQGYYRVTAFPIAP